MVDSDYIRSKLSGQALVIQLAEEAGEFAAAAAKLARVMDGTNPTHVTYDEAVNAVAEEYADVLVAMRATGIPGKHWREIGEFEIEKQKRWVQRLKELDVELQED